MYRERQCYLDWLKAAGAAAIVSLHTISNTLQADGYHVSEACVTAVHILRQFLFCAVPVFILVTGAAFLSTGRSCSYKDMRRHILKTASCIVFFGVLFYGMEKAALGGTFDFMELVQAVVGDGTWSHMWYLYRLLGLYLCMPLLAAFMKVSGMREQAALSGVLLAFTCVLPYVSGRTGIYLARVMPLSGVWLFYGAAGGFLGSIPLKRLKKYWWAPALGILLGAGEIIRESIQNRELALGEEHPALLALAVSLFAAARLLGGERESRPWLAALARTMLGVYIIHPVFLHISVRLLHLNPWRHLPILSVPLMAAAIYAVSAAAAALLRKIPAVRSFLL